MKKFASLLLITLASLSACQSEATRPTVPETAEKLTAITAKTSSPAKPVINCQAEAMVASDLSDKALRAFVSDSSYKMTKNEKASIAEGGELWQKLQLCQRNK